MQIFWLSFASIILLLDTCSIIVPFFLGGGVGWGGVKLLLSYLPNTSNLGTALRERSDF